MLAPSRLLKLGRAPLLRRRPSSSNTAPPPSSPLSFLRRHVPPEKVSAFIHLGNVCALGAMCSHDMIQLRSFMISATTMGMLYNLLQPRPLMPPVYWGLVFVAGHSAQIARILYSRAAVELDERALQLYESSFLPFSFPPRAFSELMAHAEFVGYQDGDLVAEEGAPVGYVQIIVSGSARFTHEGAHKADASKSSRAVARVIDAAAVEGHSGSWVGEAFDPRYLEHRTHAHRIEAVGETRAVRFPVGEFHRVVDGDAAALAACERIQLDDLEGKLQAYERAHEDEVVCLQGKMGELRRRVEELEGRGGGGRRGKHWWSALHA